MESREPSHLDEFITPILFCRADSEFDHDKTDPGFIKVFKLSQLIGEYLLFCHETDKDKLSSCESKCVSLELENSKAVDALSVAKKELKKTKDILAETQTKVLGENHDEIDHVRFVP